MTTARYDRHLKGPRRRVRYVYLIEAWPEGARLDHLDAFEQAPDEAVIAALTKDIDVYGDVIETLRREADQAKAERDALRDAVRLLFDEATGSVGQLHLLATGGAS